MTPFRKLSFSDNSIFSFYYFITDAKLTFDLCVSCKPLTERHVWRSVTDKIFETIKKKTFFPKRWLFPTHRSRKIKIYVKN